MNQHLGASCTLSVLLVVLFAVAFYRPESRPIASGQSRPAAPSRTNPLTGQATAGTPGASAPPREAIAGRRVEPGRAGGEVLPSRPATAGRAEPESAAVARRVSSRDSPKRAVPAPRKAFTTVGPGETLADVAARVYGPVGSAEAVWRANRDQLSSAETPLRAGMILRTP